MRVAPLLVPVWLLSLLACPPGIASTGSTQLRARPATPAPRSSSLTKQVPAAPTPGNMPPGQEISRALRVYYALARHTEAAELRNGTSQWLDFGVPGDAKYTLAGWLTFAGEARKLEGVDAMWVHGHGVRLSLPADSADSRELSLELRSFGPTGLVLSLNGKKLADRKLGGKQFETVAVSIPAGMLHAGENALELRFAQTHAVISGQGFLIDFITLSREALPPEQRRPPTPAELNPPSSPDQLQIPAGVRVGYALEVPSAAVFQAQVHSAVAAQLSVRAVRDSGPDRVLATLEVGPTPKALRIELTPLEHEVVRIDLAADGGMVTLDGPAILTPREEPSSARKPIRNVLLFLIDTLRADKLSPYNPGTRVRTPGLTHFLENAAVFQHARSQENWTKPSVATLLSSLFPWQHNTFSDDAVLPESVELLPELLQKRGFFTGAFIANGYVSDKFGFKQGFSSYRNYIREGRRSVAQAVAGDVLQWLDARPQDKPFFLYVHTIDPHVPYRPPKEYLALYDALPYAGPVNFGGDAELLEKIKMGRIPLSPRDKVRLEALYDGEISYHDVHFDAIMHGLDTRGLADNTLVVVTADHGEEFWDHGSVGHGHSVFDELLHVPLMVRLPGVTRRSASVSADVGLVDVAPTILDALGESPSADMSGRSFLPELLGECADAPRVAVSGFMTGWRTIAVGSWKLVQRALDRFWLYDTASDPGETQDLSAAHPISVRYLRGALGLALAGGVTHNAAHRTHAAEKTAIDAATEQQLRALGYVGSARH